MQSHIKTARSTGLPTEMRRELVAARRAKGWSQAELGQRVGLPQVHISRIENGKTSPQYNTLIELVRALEHDLVLVPRQLVPAALALVRDFRRRDAGIPAEEARPLYPDFEDDGDES